MQMLASLGIVAIELYFLVFSQAPSIAAGNSSDPKYFKKQEVEGRHHKLFLKACKTKSHSENRCYSSYIQITDTELARNT